MFDELLLIVKALRQHFWFRSFASKCTFFIQLLPASDFPLSLSLSLFDSFDLAKARTRRYFWKCNSKHRTFAVSAVQKARKNSTVWLERKTHYLIIEKRILLMHDFVLWGINFATPLSLPMSIQMQKQRQKKCTQCLWLNSTFTSSFSLASLTPSPKFIVYWWHLEHFSTAMQFFFQKLLLANISYIFVSNNDLRRTT